MNCLHPHVMLFLFLIGILIINDKWRQPVHVPMRYQCVTCVSHVVVIFRHTINTNVDHTHDRSQHYTVLMMAHQLVTVVNPHKPLGVLRKPVEGDATSRCL